MQTATLTIDGMHCQGCVQIVQHVIEQQAGVKGCSVSLDPQQARVAHDADQVSAQTLAKAVQEAGYKATVADR
ncbi:heavy-metal-associated domain-containing protein [Salinisphaera sp. T31B1]|uniref:heavy-metal-associated domain-containing protein n=1 Tax=Salinisphaera sp. T31B1 TaxID=727963 RepID=UPI00333FA5C9